jgi:hypothetical protein
MRLKNGALEPVFELPLILLTLRGLPLENLS